MNDENLHQSQPPPLEMKSQQRAVEGLLKKIKSEYPLDKWYLGALHALGAINNPDHIAQAAHSLRELLEKLLESVHGKGAGPPSNCKEQRRTLHKRFGKDKERYEENWKGREIDDHLTKTLKLLDCYLESNQSPTRGERVGEMMSKEDPMIERLGGKFQREKETKLTNLWAKLESITHHGRSSVQKLKKCLEDLERILFNLYAPITKEDQIEIQLILKRPHRSTDDENRMFLLIERRAANFFYFFSQVTHPTWVDTIKERNYLTEDLFPFMIPYLEKISESDPSLVVDTILVFKDTDDSPLLRMIVEIVQKIKPIEQSLRLKVMVLKSLRRPHRLNASKHVADIMSYWAQGPSEAVNSALDLMKEIVVSKRNHELPHKQGWDRDNISNLAAFSLNSEPHVSWWIYDKILKDGVQPLSEIRPLQTARILIDATAKMLNLKFHSDMPRNVDNDDGSTIWCPRLNATDEEHVDSEKSLVHALTLACEKVYKKMPESVPTLNSELQKQSWFIFTRIQQHLYALHPNEETRPWIREMILNYRGYRKREYHFELQRMIRCACENIGDNLLDEDEKERIFEDILNGPSEEEIPEKYKRYFHRMQLKPFASVLFGKYANYFKELEAREKQPIVDNDYMPYRNSGVKIMENASPKPHTELGKMPDDELLSYLNKWDDVRRDPDQWWVDINFPGLAKVFQSLFMETILPDKTKLEFWMDNLDRIQRPVYVRAMVSAMHEYAKHGKFDRLDQCFDLCEWVLSQPNQPMEEGASRNEKSKEHLSWENSRREVVDFVEMCMQDDVNAPISSRYRLASLLDKLCIQYDRRLDDDDPVLPARDDLYAEAINNTRGQALYNLVNFGYWVRRQLKDVQADTHEIFSILDKRLDLGCEHPLALPERAILGSNYHLLFYWNKEWATKRKTDIFPQKNQQNWAVAFGNYLNHNRPNKLMFDIVQDDIKIALGDMDRFKIKSFGLDDPIDSLGRHLFSYYLLKFYPLTGKDSLLESFYNKTNEDHWAHLLGSTGNALKDKQLDDSLLRRIVQFAEWRLNKKNLSERKEFLFFWIQSGCLDEKWRLNALSDILDTNRSDNPDVYTTMNFLQKMVNDHTDLVMDCFLKLIKLTIKNKGDDHSLAHKAKPILRVGLAGDNTVTQAKAKQAEEYLRKLGHSNFLDDAEE